MIQENNMIKTINKHFLNDIVSHTRKLSARNYVLNSSMRYERCGEFTYISEKLEPFFNDNLKYLDIGTGNSAFPSYILKKTKWDVTCLDKFSWVQMQKNFVKKVMGNEDYSSRFHIIEQDFIDAELPAESYDIITNISVIEHFEGTSDSLAMEKSAKLLKKGGLYILTTPINDKYYKEFFLNQSVYGEKFTDKPVFFQRHYDVASFDERIVKPSGLKEKERIYMGDYGFQFKESVIDLPMPFKPLKILYQWAVPHFASQFLTYRDYPVSRSNMKMNTTSAVITILEK